jgi:hypothetical protein
MLLTAAVLDSGSPNACDSSNEAKRSCQKADTMPNTQNRRRFLSALSAAGTVGLFGDQFQALKMRHWKRPEFVLRRAPPYVTRPKYVAEDLLRAEGFTNFQYLLHADQQPRLRPQ